jgi:hypothetical protein
MEGSASIYFPYFRKFVSYYYVFYCFLHHIILIIPAPIPAWRHQLRRIKALNAVMKFPEDQKSGSCTQ